MCSSRVPKHRPWVRAATLLALLAVAMSACAPAAQPTVSERADVRPFVLPPLQFDERRFVAVYDIEVEPVRFDVAVLPARERDPRRLVDLSRGIVDVVTNELIDLGRFRVVERQRLDRILQEQDLGQTGRFDNSTVAEIGRLLNAELILTGAVSEFSLDRASAGSAVFGLVGGTTITTARIGVDLRFVDVTTGEVLGVGRGLGIASDAEITIEGLELAMQLLRAGTVRESIVAIALRNAIRNALEDASTALPPRAR
jgi:curli biogenesis system outer membrane secretion channel CsgG